MKRYKIFHAQIDLLPSILGWIHEILVEVGAKLPLIGQVELALEEALVNIIHHAYKDKPGDIEIQILSALGKETTIILKDKGPPFNPLTVDYTPPDPSLPLEELEEGGLGVFFMKQYLDSIVYKRESSYNVLILTKNFSY
ncbi:MAG: ATP-binding protein [Chlamydiales bacterium]|nr:ATP-binding protein [Chlamydiales bacterium]